MVEDIINVAVTLMVICTEGDCSSHVNVYIYSH